jgi:superfamily II DNA/RNA helicase
VPVDRAEQELFHVPEEGKTELLRQLLKKETGRVLIFVRTKRGVDRLAPRLGRSGGPVARLHGDREQLDRDEAMAGFREGRYRILIATDIAARGLDVADIEHVINYDFPRSAEDYIHRIGRTARLAARGRATSFVTGVDRRVLAEVEKLIGTKIPSTRVSGAPEAETEEAPHGRASGGSHGQRRRGSGGHRTPHGRREGPPSPQSPHGHKDTTSSPHGHKDAAAAPHGHKDAVPASHNHKDTALAPHTNKDTASAPNNRKEGPAAATPATGQEAAPRPRRRRRRGKGRGPQPEGGQAPAAGNTPHAASGEAPAHAPKPHTPHHPAKPEPHTPPSA